MSSRLSCELCGIPLRNPVLAASGTFGYGIEFASILDLNQLGGIVTKGLSREPIAGNPAPRLWPVEAGMINSVGLQNVGVRAFIENKLPALRKYSVPVIANVFGYRTEDYAEVVRQLEQTSGIAGYELNVSCPNTEEGGMLFSNDPAALAQVVAKVRAAATRPLIVKLSPNVASIPVTARAAEAAGADAISLVNTFVSLAVDSSRRVPHIGAGFGGLSGPAIRPIALRMVAEAAQAVRIPVVGLGGITNGETAAEFLLAGASAVQVGTASFVDPRAPLLVARQLDAFLQRQGAQNLAQWVGGLRMPARSATPAASPIPGDRAK